VRVALGETLPEADQAVYEAGKRKLDGADALQVAVPGVAETRAALAKLDAENAQLRARAEKLNTEIAALEAALERKSRQPLGAGD
jgi:cell division protein FtsB